MTQAEELTVLREKVAALENTVRLLQQLVEAQRLMAPHPVVIPQPVFVPQTPYAPWPQPWVTCGASA